MKYLIFILLIFSLTSTSADSSDPLIERLKKYTTQDIEADKKIKNEKDLNIEKMFADLKEANTRLLQKGPVPDLITEAARVSELTFIHDNSFYAAEILLPSYRKHKTLFQKTLSKDSRKELKDFLKMLQSKDREFKKGNG